MAPVLNICENTLDDAMRQVLSHLLTKGHSISPRKGSALEHVGAAIEIRNPLARASRSLGRSRILSALGEFLWYLSGTDESGMISYYIPEYRTFEVDNRLEGAYGPRLFGSQGQLEQVIQTLHDRPDSRQAIAQIFRFEDLKNQKDVPCTVSLQFFSRSSALHLVVNMRSNDAYIGLPHDVFAFTMIQEIVARRLGLQLGTYFHFVGSLHLYDAQRDRAEAFLAEGWQSPQQMPEMPEVEIAHSLASLVEAEQRIRISGSIEAEMAALGSEPYWDDLKRLLLAKATRDPRVLNQIYDALSDPYYRIYVSDRLQRNEVLI